MMIKRRDFPLRDSQLQRYRLQLDRRASSVPPGDRLLRRRGQSLQFREYAPYSLGDDIRSVDWRLSLSRGAPWELWKKTFDAEDAQQVVITVDTSQTLDGSEGSSKRVVAWWLAEAIARVALLGSDRVVLHRLEAHQPDESTNDSSTTIRSRDRQGADVSSDLRPLSDGRGSNLHRLFEWRGAAREVRSMGQVNAHLDALKSGTLETNGLGVIERRLVPTAAMVIVSDFYCSARHSEMLARSVDQAVTRRCAVVIVELDSWPWERSLLARDGYLIDGPGVSVERDNPRYEVDDDLIARVEKKIADNKSAFFRRLNRLAAHTRCSWPAGGTLQPETLFGDWFENDAVLAKLLVRGAS
ncbi:MAG: DUF58 domain-containing protein [Planctomycetaceae bacterium]